MKNKDSLQGYTLVELSVVLVIVSLLTAGGLVLGAGMVNQAAHIDTKKILEQLDQSLRDYYVVNGRLPCPASLTEPLDSSDFGDEVNGGSCVGSAITGTESNSGVRVGMIPSRTLGLSNKAASDRYANRIVYAVTEGLTATGSFATTDGAVTVHDRHGVTLTDAAYMIISPGKDHNGAYFYSTNALASTCSTVDNLDGENCDYADNAVFRDAPFNNGDTALFFDDQTRWVPKYHLTAKTTTSSSLWSAEGAGTDIYAVGTDSDLNTGNVGIGTTQPYAKLTVNGGSHDTGISFIRPDTRDARIRVGDDTQQWSMSSGWESSGDFSIIQEGVSGNRIYIKQNGDIGLSTSIPAAKLDVVNVGNGAPILRLGSERPWRFEQFGAGNSAQMDLKSLSADKQLNIKASDGDSIASFYAATTPANAVVSMLPSGGQVRIGQTTADNHLLTVAGTQNNGIKYLRTDGRDARIEVGDTTQSWSMAAGWATAGDFSIIQEGVAGNRLYIKRSNGNVGLGTSDPSEKLQVDGNIMIPDGGEIKIDNGRRVFRGTNGFTYLYGGGYNTLHTSSGGVGILDSNSIGTGQLIVYGSSGRRCTIQGHWGGWSCTSDERLKREIQPLDAPLDKLMALNGVSFKWRNDLKSKVSEVIDQESGGVAKTAKPFVDESRHIGVIAQDVQKVFPEAVFTDDEGHLSVEMTNLIPPLIEAVKELNARNAALQGKVDALQGGPAAPAPAQQPTYTLVIDARIAAVLGALLLVIIGLLARRRTA